MTAIADLVTLLASTGIPPDKIAEAVDLAQKHAAESAEFHRNSTGIPPDRAAEKRRAYDRERKRKVRGIPPDTTQNAISILPLQEKGLSVVKKESKRARNCGERLPDDWRPSPEHYEQGAALGMTRADVDSQAEDLRLWARANEHRAVARKSNWNLTFTGWMRRNRPKAHGAVNGKRTVHDAAAEALERLRALNEPAPSDLRDGAGQGAFRLLPSR